MALQVENITKTYGTDVIIKNISLTASDNEKIGLIGPNGAGKSTLIKLILLEETPTSGKIYVNAHNVSKIKKTQVQRYRRSIGVFFQDFRLLEKKTVFQNDMFDLLSFCQLFRNTPDLYLLIYFYGQ